MYYGWKIVGVTFVTHFISVGFIFYSYPVFFDHLEADLSASRFGLSMGLAIINIMTGLFAPFLGWALDHRSIRRIMAVGTLSLALSFIAASRVTTLWQLYFVVAWMGLGAAAIGGLPGSTLVSKWFIRKRGMALGISTMGISLSGVVMSPLSAQIIAALGWRNTFIVYGCVALALVMPLVLWLVHNRPEDMGLSPDGVDPSDPAEAIEVAEPMVPLAPGDQLIDHSAHLEWTALNTLRERKFWIISIAIALNFCAMSAMLIHSVPRALDLGISAARAPFVLSFCAGAGVIGKIAFGAIADRVDIRGALWISIGFQAVGAYLFTRVESYPALLATGAIFGFGMGGIVPLWGSLIGQAFGRESFGRVMGLMSPCMLPIQSVGVPFAGYVFDKTGSYDIAFQVFVGLYIVAAAVLALLGPNPGANLGTTATAMEKPLARPQRS